MTRLMHPQWPPREGRAFIQSDEFGTGLLQSCIQMQRLHPDLDFSDAVAQLFEWLDRKLKADPMFVNGERFFSESAFWAYVRLAILRAAFNEKRKTLRRRSRQLSLDSPVFSISPSPLALAARDEIIDRLGQPCADIVRRMLDGDSDGLTMYADLIGMPVAEIERIFERCVDRLATDPEIQALRQPRRRHRRKN